MALITFGVDASHGYERIHALRSLAERVTAYVQNPVQIKRDAQEKPGEPAAPPPSRPRRPISR